MNGKKIRVQVARQAVSDPNVDLPTFLNAVYEAVLRNFQLFGAEDTFDLYPEEISLSSVVLYNHKTRTYTRASISSDENGNVSFSDVQKVRRQWVPVDSVERSDDEFFSVEMKQRGSFWASFL